jgi:hypothetical protein
MTRFKTGLLTAALILAALTVVDAQAELKPGIPGRFSLAAKQQKEFTFEAREGQLVDLRIDLKDYYQLEMTLKGPGGEKLVENADAFTGWIFVADESGTYRLTFKLDDNDDEDKSVARAFAVTFSNKLALPKTAVTKATRKIGGYDARIVEDPKEEGASYLLIKKGSELKGVMRRGKQITGGLFFSDDAEHVYDDTEQKRANLLYRQTPDKTGDGNPDISVEYYSGGAHCCFDITFFELGDKVRQLETIGTDNDRLKALRKRPGGGLLFHWSEQVFAYWAIAFAFSPFPDVIYDFRNGELTPRFDLMKKPAPAIAVLKRKAAAAKAKISLTPWVDPVESFNDFEEAFWGDMLDLIYTGHEDLAWQYLDWVWPANKPGKQKFAADFREQLAESAYGTRK